MNEVSYYDFWTAIGKLDCIGSYSGQSVAIYPYTLTMSLRNGTVIGKIVHHGFNYSIMKPENVYYLSEGIK